jgi:hypothetical protein
MYKLYIAFARVSEIPRSLPDQMILPQGSETRPAYSCDPFWFQLFLDHTYAADGSQLA